MPTTVNTSFLRLNTDFLDEAKDSIVSVDHVSMIFNIASETLNSLKEYAIALARRELRLKEFRALDDISIEVKKGDVFGILGTNGSGKSTLLKIIAGVLEPSEGTCTVLGQIAPLIELGAGFDMELTARENIYLNGALLGYSKSFIDSHFDEIVDFAEIGPFLDMPMKNYSSGMVARIAFAIATAVIPDLLIVDEVLSVGDFMFQQKCERRISSLINEHQVTVLIVSHDNYMIERLCNKAIWIEKGHTRMVGSAKEVCEAYRMLGGREGSQEFEDKISGLLFDKSIQATGSFCQTVKGDSLYSHSLKLAEMSFKDKTDCLILTPSASGSENYVALGMSKVLDCPILTVPTDSIADATLQGIREFAPKRIYLIGDTKFISAKIEKDIFQEYGQIELIRIHGNSPGDLSLKIFNEIDSVATWGETAAISYEKCTADLTSLSPLLYTLNTPLFFYEKVGIIDPEIIKLIKKRFSRLLVVGGEDHFPQECLAPFIEANIEIVRICGKGPYDANLVINDFIDDEYHKMGIEKAKNVLITSSWRPEYSFTLGTFAGKEHATILLEDAGSLKSTAFVIDYLKENASNIDKIIFIGDEKCYSDGEKTLLEKALLSVKKL